MACRRLLYWFKKKQTGAVPAQPAAPVPSNETANGVTLTWAAVAGARLYTLERSTDSTFATGVTTVFQSTSELTFDDTGLSASTLYYYRLIVSNRYGDSPPSDVAVVTLDTPTPPGTPSAPTVTGQTTTTVSLSWTAVPLATSYTLERSVSPFTSWTTRFTGNALAFVDTGLTAATTYHYRLKASNADGTSAASTETPATTDGAPSVPATPAQPTASNITSSSVQITWTAVSGATDYELQRRQTAPSTTAFATVYGPGPNTTFLQTGLSASATYEFKVRASNSAGASAYSTVRIITTSNPVGTNVQPWSAYSIRTRSGVADHPNFNTSTSVYKVSGAANRIKRLADNGVYFIRGGLGTVYEQYATILRQHNMKWMIGVIQEASRANAPAPPTDDTVAQTRASIRAIRENIPDVVLGLEGINEPNNNRGAGSQVVDNWAQITVDHQRAIWQEAKWNLLSVNGPIGNSPTQGSVPNPLRNVTVIGPGLHDSATSDSYTQANPIGGKFHWDQLADLGILQLQNAANLHSYAGGDVPLGQNYNPAQPTTSGKIDAQRIKWLRQAYGADYPFFITEWGWHNALNTSAGHRPITEAGAGTYVARGYLQILAKAEPNNKDRGVIGLDAFETMDDYDPGAKDAHEANFGWIGYDASKVSNATEATDPANWRNKPILTKFGAFMNRLRDPDTVTDDYVPNRVLCNISSPASNATLAWVVTATKAQSNAGTATAWVWRDLPIWNSATEVTLNVAPVTVNIQDRVGTRSFQIDAEVTGVDLR